MSAGASVSPARIRRARAARSRLVARALVLGAVLAGLLAAAAFLYAGSPERIADGVRVGGVDVGGLTASQAVDTLERRSERLQRTPVTFTAAGRSWKVGPAQLGVKVDWVAAVEAARRTAGGVGPVRGLRRLQTRVFGVDVAPPARVYDPALRYALNRFAAAIDRPARDAAVELRGLKPVLVPGRPGRRLDRPAAASLVVRALSSPDRSARALPVSVARPDVTARDLAPVVAQTRTALSAPVRLALGETRWRIPRWRVAGLLSLPNGGARRLEVGGKGADAWLAALARRVNRPAANARFTVHANGTVGVIPGRDGLKLDERATAGNLLGALLSPSARTAKVVVAAAPPERTTAEAKAMGITREVQSYTTTYGGIANRLHNVRLVSKLIDGAVIAPGETFSFNGTTGERSADKGFLEAPVIVNGELTTGLGGGVCQVSTTVYNAAYEAGLPIVERTNHALYISHYPLGRDATVDYPALDLKFRNDTGHALLLRTWVGTSSLTVSLYGTPVHRRVVSEASALRVTGPAPVKRVPDPTLAKGKKVVVSSGQPSRSTSVRRRVYAPGGKLLSDATFSSSYRGEPTVLRVGTKAPPKPETKPAAKKKDGAKPGTTTGTTPPPPPPPPPPAGATRP